MKKIISLIIGVLSLTIGLSSKAKVEMTDANLKFSFMTQDGDYSLTCRHWKTVQDIPEWEILCGEGGANVKSFRAHFVLEETSKFKFTYVLIITDRTERKVNFKTHAATIMLQNSAPVEGLSLQQGVEHDTGLLFLEYTR